jgi:GntR family transcriptional repressor for pyruvate dehydrogenase complex
LHPSNEAARQLDVFEKIQRVNAAEAVRNQLLDRLASGSLDIGDKLPSENELARSFGVSRPVIREAIGTLRAQGLIASQNGKGSFVTARRPPEEGFSLRGGYTSDDLHEVRCNIEIPGAGAAALRRTAADIRRLERNVGKQRECTDLSAWARLDVEFHALLAAAMKNPLQERLLAALRELHEDQSVRVLDALDRTRRALSEHEAILAAVVARDAAAARVAMGAHLEAIFRESHELVATAKHRTKEAVKKEPPRPGHDGRDPRKRRPSR